MNTTTPQDEDDEVFDRKLRKLYQAALFDENFQLQVAADLHALPPEAQAKLNASDREFIAEHSLSESLTEKLLAVNCGCSEAPQFRPWWKTLLPIDFNAGRFLTPGFSIPMSLAAGLLLGLVLPTLLQQQGAEQFRGGITSTTQPETPVGSISEDIKQQPQQWLGAIADLVRQGKVSEAQTQLQEFMIRHPGYSARSEPPSPKITKGAQ